MSRVKNEKGKLHTTATVSADRQWLSAPPVVASSRPVAASAIAKDLSSGGIHISECASVHGPGSHNILTLEVLLLDVRLLDTETDMTMTMKLYLKMYRVFTKLIFNM